MASNLFIAAPRFRNACGTANREMSHAPQDPQARPGASQPGRRPRWRRAQPRRVHLAPMVQGRGRPAPCRARRLLERRPAHPTRRRAGCRHGGAGPARCLGRLVPDHRPWPRVLTPGEFNHIPHLAKYGLPADLSGKRVLDIGTFDDFWAFQFEKRGTAEVMALDVETFGDIDFPAGARDHGCADARDPARARLRHSATHPRILMGVDRCGRRAGAALAKQGASCGSRPLMGATSRTHWRPRASSAM